MDTSLADALKSFSESCDRLSTAIDRRDAKDRARTNKLVSAMAAITMTCVGLVVSGSVNSYRTDADLRSHITEENRAWQGEYDKLGRKVSDGRSDLIIDTNKNTKELAAWLLRFMHANPSLKDPDGER